MRSGTFWLGQIPGGIFNVYTNAISFVNVTLNQIGT